MDMDITDGVKTTGLCQYYLGFLRHSLKLGLDYQATALTDLDSKVFEAIIRLLLILLTPQLRHHGHPLHQGLVLGQRGGGAL